MTTSHNTSEPIGQARPQPKPQPQPLAGRRRRPHPARRARRALGAAGTGGMLVLTGYMVLHDVAGSTSQSTTAVDTGNAAVAPVVAAPTTTAATVIVGEAESDDGARVVQLVTTAPATTAVPVAPVAVVAQPTVVHQSTSKASG